MKNREVTDAMNVRADATEPKRSEPDPHRRSGRDRSGRSSPGGFAPTLFRSAGRRRPALGTIEPQIFPSVAVGIGGTLVYVAACYLFFRPRLEEQTVSSMEEIRNGIGIWCRVMYGGIAEEVMTRWGLMSLLV